MLDYTILQPILTYEDVTGVVIGMLHMTRCVWDRYIHAKTAVGSLGGLENHVDLLCLTDSEASLQSIHKWIGWGARLNLSKSPDADILKAIILKLQKRVEAGASTLLIKVKAHRGDPLNEEADIRAELGPRKEYKETIWDNLSGRTVYQ
jgi:hypothetical protein